MLYGIFQITLNTHTLTHSSSQTNTQNNSLLENMCGAPGSFGLLDCVGESPEQWPQAFVYLRQLVWSTFSTFLFLKQRKKQKFWVSYLHWVQLQLKTKMLTADLPVFLFLFCRRPTCDCEFDEVYTWTEWVTRPPPSPQALSPRVICTHKKLNKILQCYKKSMSSYIHWNSSLMQNKEWTYLYKTTASRTSPTIPILEMAADSGILEWLPLLACTTIYRKPPKSTRKMNSQQQLTFSPVSAVTARALKVQLERAGGPAITLSQLRSKPCDCTAISGDNFFV